MGRIMSVVHRVTGANAIVPLPSWRLDPILISSSEDNRREPSLDGTYRVEIFCCYAYLSPPRIDNLTGVEVTS